MAERINPILSIIVPVYAVQDYVGECLKSITHAPGFNEYCELIVIDDGSPDESMVIVARLCADLRNVTIIRQVNAGLGAARNAGLARARGKAIWFVDSDDLICDVAICTLLRTIDRFSPDIIAFEFDTLGGSLNRPSYLGHYDERVHPLTFLTSGRPPSGVPFYAFSHTLLKNTNLWFERGIYHEDALFTALAMTRAATLVRVRETCYIYRLRSGSITAMKQPEKHLSDMLSIAGLLANEARCHPIGSRVRQALGREIGFALAAMRYYANRTDPRTRRQRAPIGPLLQLGREWWRCFRWRELINYVRLLCLLRAVRKEPA